MGSFYSKGNSNAVIDYELNYLPKEYTVDRKGFCLFHHNDLETMVPERVLQLYEHHGLIMELFE